MKRRTGSLKNKKSETETSLTRKVSHSYCEAVVYNGEDEEQDGGSYQNTDRIIPGGARARSTSMFETGGKGPFALAQHGIPEIYTEYIDYVDEGAAGEGEPKLTIMVEEDGQNKTGMTLDEAVMKMGVDCPYKDLI